MTSLSSKEQDAVQRIKAIITRGASGAIDVRRDLLANGVPAEPDRVEWSDIRADLRTLLACLEKVEGETAQSQPCGLEPAARSSGLDAGGSGQLTVETAAIRIGDAVFTLPRPNRHHNVMWWLHVLGVNSGLMHDQGFVLSDGTFAERGRAFGVAASAQQLIGEPPVPGTLFSEDLWDGGADLPTMDEIKWLSTPTASPAERQPEPREAINPAPRPTREEVARIIDPRAWELEDDGAFTGYAQQKAVIVTSLSKADTILSLFPEGTRDE